jgi:hypothetical protein
VRQSARATRGGVDELGHAEAALPGGRLRVVVVGATDMTARGAAPKGLRLRGPEKAFCEAAINAKRLTLKSGDRIRAEVIRRLLLSLPLQGGPYRLTPAGITLKGGTIEGELDLDNVIMAEGGPVAPLELRGCTFEKGFRGAHGHFSRLSLEWCRFQDPAVRSRADRRSTVDLTGATIESDLSMRGVRPDRKRDFLWIRASGARIKGQIDLSRSHLRAPPERAGRLMSEPAFSALNISLAEVGGDFQFLNGAHSEGSISARRAVIRGDVWMSGALIEATASHALFFQSAEIGGLMMLDGRPDDAAQSGDCQPFRAFGQINLSDLQLGGSLILSNVQLRPPRPVRLTARARAGSNGGDDDVPQQDGGDPNFICLRLDEARIGDSVRIAITCGERSRFYGQLCLVNAEIENLLIISDAFLGVLGEESDEVVAVQASFLTARKVYIVNVEPLLWEEPAIAPRPEMMALSMDFEDAKVESLTFVDCWLNGRFTARALRCANDLSLDARVGGGVDLEGAGIGGSLDISELRLDQGAKGLNLKDAEIAHSLRLTHSGLPAAGIMHLARARRRALICLPSMELMECLWRCDGDADRPKFLQTGFLINEDGAFLLDGKQATFESAVGHFGHSIADPQAAEEFVRLHCVYARGDRGPLVMITQSEGLPPFLKADPNPWESVPSMRRGRVAAALATAGPEQVLALLDPAVLEPKTESSNGSSVVFDVEGCCLQSDRIVRLDLRLKTDARPLSVKVLKEKSVIRVNGGPRVDHQFLCHPEDADPAKTDVWVNPPAVAGLEPVADAELAALEAKLGYYVRTSCALYGEADLTGLVCGMLDDNAGRSWGSEVVVPMNHFVYSRTTWIGKDAEDPAPLLTSLLQGVRVEAARRLPLWLSNRLGWTSGLKRSSGYCSGWQARLNWIYQQYDTIDLPQPSRFRINQANYSPQPFDQAIKVCRAEGREDYALHFEVEKQKVEWRLRNRRNRAWLASVGLIAALLYLLLTDADTHNRWPIAAALAIGIASISYAASFVLRFMFGYLRRPVRAIATLVSAFLIGWGGVHIVNERHLLIVDVEPVAGLAARHQGRIQLGSQNATDATNSVRSVHCDGTISEGLYALDVLIPLIDLREEDRCEIGEANDIERIRRDQPIRPAWVGVLFGPIIDSERFWAAAKAVYAIAGWFIVSLSILTFAQANRTWVET